ncbi:MAG: ion transporter [Brumimicrobium sp.]|nr:ion transporter [Brumimicrobium sp.]
MKSRFNKQFNIKEKDFELRPWQQKINEIIHGTETRGGKLFDIILLLVILFSVVIIMLESIKELNAKYGEIYTILEWIVTGLFTIEYVLRILSLKKPFSYIFSFYGIIDLLALLPSYLGLFYDGSKALVVLRVVRFLRIFKILRMSHYIQGANILTDALKNSRAKIIVFLLSMLTIVIIMGGIMYFVESDEAGFTSIPRSIYWAIITITTVGYGDIAPLTPVGQALASIIMLFGYAIIAVPTGIVSSEITNQKNKTAQDIKPYECPTCGATGHDKNAKFCKQCGEKFE